MYHLMILKKALQSYSIFQHVSVVATPIIGEKLEQRCYKALFILLCTPLC
jgi:hypothetical protein